MLEVQGFGHGGRQPQVPDVHGIERAAENADHLCRSHGYSRIWPVPRATNLVVVSSRTPIAP